ncbi:MAG: N-acetyltransferase [Deltaproteobacteria bacterium]|nr:N-acetyltransferase [Candidatus Zymogenaceae bacterium]
MVTIRREEESDRKEVYFLTEQAFRSDEEPRLVDRIRESDDFIHELSLVAIDDDTLVGHIIFSVMTIQTEGEDIPALCLGPVSVVPEYQRRGIGSKLVRHGLAECQRLGYHIIVLVGHPEYYPRFGFRPANERGLSVDGDIPPDAFMVYEGISGALDGVTGKVVFSPAFDGMM